MGSQRGRGQRESILAKVSISVSFWGVDCGSDCGKVVGQFVGESVEL